MASGQDRCAYRATIAIAFTLAVLGGGCRETTTSGLQKQWAGACEPCHDVRPLGAHALALRSGHSGPLRPVECSVDGLEDSHPSYILGGLFIEQPLIEMEKGRIQALPVGWDVQRGEWFQLLAESPLPGDWNHWRNPGMTANAQCLVCHVTGYERRYDELHEAYDSRWIADGVQCEACHGPGAAHVSAYSAPGSVGPTSLQIVVDPESAGACAPCHMRHTAIADGYLAGARLADHFDPALLETDIFAPDGTVVDEAFEWTSFQMSVMGRRGVRCTDCHDAHTTALHRTGNALCLGCHEASLADSGHTHHLPQSDGSLCAACHMPTTVFMARDRRQDHSFPRPDPALSAEIGTRDPCTDCHQDRSQGWAAEVVERWWGPSSERERRRRVARAFRWARQGNPAAASGLVDVLASDADMVRRASAARLLAAFTAQEQVVDALVAASRDAEPFVRAAAMTGLGGAATNSAAARDALLAGVRDERRLVRIEAAFSLAPLPLETLDAGTRSDLEAAAEEWISAQLVNGDDPTAHYNLGRYWEGRRDAERAEAAYRRALRLWDGLLEARQNLAMLLARTGRVGEAETEFRSILARRPGWPPAAFSLALLYAGQQRFTEARDLLMACVQNDPSFPRALYNLGVVLARLGDINGAFERLEAATAAPDSRADAVRALAGLARRHGDRNRLRRWGPEASLLGPAHSRQVSHD